MAPHLRRTLARTNSALTTVALGVFCFTVIGCNNAPQSALAAATPAPTVAAGGETLFEKVTDFTVKGKVAEIVTASPDGKTLVYSNATDGQIGFVDITDPAKPRDTQQIKVGGEPTSVSISPNGKWLLCCVHGQPDHLLVFDFKTRQLLRQIDLPGQPDCVSISGDNKFAAIAIENERTDMDKPMPQMPAGMLTIVDMKGAPAAWKLRQVDLRGLPLRFPTDPEPEFISIDARNRAAVTLQENNGVVIVDLASGKILNSFSTGAVTHAADTKDDGRADFSDQIKDSPREPDAIGWTRGGNLITANEGDYDLELKKGQYTGGRNATLFSPEGKVLFDFNDIETAIAAARRYNDKRSGKKGVEPEGVAIARYTVQKQERDLAFIGCERADSVAVYDITNENRPQFLQILATGERPEGLLALTKRGLFVSANEGDGTISIFKLK